MKSFDEELKEFEVNAESFSDAAYPVELNQQYSSRPDLVFKSTAKGLSKREYFAALALQGLLSGIALTGTTPEWIEQASQNARFAADTLIEELNKETNENITDNK